MSFETCRHVKEDGAYCASPALRGRNYCYHHLMQRGRRLRRALALSRNEPAPLTLPSLENLGSICVALNEIVQALASGQLDHRSAGLMLYAIQQTTTVTLRINQMQAALQEEGANPGAIAGNSDGLQEYPEFERHFDIQPGIDLDAETDRLTRRAEDQAAVLSVAPNPLPGSDCPVRVKMPYTREEAYQSFQWEIRRLRQQVREYQEINEDLRRLGERKKEVASAAAQTLPDATSA